MSRNETKPKSKWASRKLWMAISGLLIVLATEWLGVDSNTAEQIISAVCVIVPAFIGGQSIVDAIAEYSKTPRR